MDVGTSSLRLSLLPPLARQWTCPHKTIAAATCDNTLFGGDVVNATTTGYWTAWSFATVASAGSTIQIARVLPCAD